MFRKKAKSPDRKSRPANEDGDDDLVFIPNQMRGEPTGEIAPQAWMTRPLTKSVMTALLDDDGDARFVGGCVRDAIIKRPVQDVDIATPLLPEDVINRLTNAGIKVIETGLRHGTVTAVNAEDQIEITTLRKDTETDGRHAKVAFTGDWTIDAARRDFTFNALSCSVTREVFDPFDGLLDLAEGRVRFIGAAKERIAEDYLRILRFFRFFATHGRQPIDQNALGACRQFRMKLATLSAERVRDELFKILATASAADVVDIMRAERILEPILPEAQNIGVLRLMVWFETRAFSEGTLEVSPLRRLASVLTGGEDEAIELSNRLRFSNNDRKRLVAMRKSHPTLNRTIDDNDRLKLLYQLGRQTFIDILLLNWSAERAEAATGCQAHSPDWVRLLDWAQDAEVPKFPLTGKDLVDMGLEPGPKVGAHLKELHDDWLDAGLKPDRAHLIQEAKNRITTNKA